MTATHFRHDESQTKTLNDRALRFLTSDSALLNAIDSALDSNKLFKKGIEGSSRTLNVETRQGRDY